MYFAGDYTIEVIELKASQEVAKFDAGKYACRRHPGCRRSD